VVFIFLLAYGVEPVWTWVLTPLVVLGVVVLTTAVSMLLSALYVRIRDVANVWGVLSMMLFYATPVLYPIEEAPEGVREVIQLNPLTPIFEQAREWIIDPNAEGAVEAAQGNGLLVLIPALLFIAICAMGVWIFNREAPNIAEAL
jgi:ABC-2 type transport system permease protein